LEHVVLLGDSIFDNAPYVPAGTEVSYLLQTLLGVQSQVSLLARDGSVLADMVDQVARLRALSVAPTQLIVSCGGNDVLGLVGAMHSPVDTVLAATELLASWQASFRRDYRQMLDAVLSQALPVALATIYDWVPGLSPGLRVALAAFNDVILREAVAHHLPVLDLRLVCDEPADYASSSPIEPSAQGGRKIAATIAEIVRAQSTQASRTVVFGEATRTSSYFIDVVPS
jgi:hypothetical protein